MREYVCMGTEAHVTTFRQTWMDRGVEMMKSISLDVEIDVANDPFFGRAGRLLANNQRDTAIHLRKATTEIPRGIEIKKAELETLKANHDRTLKSLAELERDLQLVQEPAGLKRWLNAQREAPSRVRVNRDPDDYC